MPKENVNDIVTNGFRVEVTWRKDREHEEFPNTPGHVQLATISQDSPFAFPAIPGDDEGPGQPEHPFDGWYVTLDPPAIERLVDALMKAGAQAYPEWKRDWSSSGSATP